MDTVINPFFRRIHRQGVGRRVPRYCVATLSLAASGARSLLAYLSDASRCSLMEQLAIRLSPQAGKSLLMCGSLHLILQNEFPEASI
jgi:hypothetical protein